MWRRTTHFALALGIVGLVGCRDGDSGRDIDDGAEGTADGDGDGDGGDADDGGEDPPRTYNDQPWGRSSLRRLTSSQYRNTVAALFGTGIPLPESLDPDLLQHLFTTVGASKVSTSALGVEQYETAALDIATHVFGDATLRGQLVGCSPSQNSCVRDFLEAFGRRAWRRPLSGEELDRYVQLAGDTTSIYSDDWAGLQFAVTALLQSPNFMHMVELGEPEPGRETRYRYTSHEMASRLSYFLVNGPPDPKLVAAATAGTLTSRNKIEKQARRLLKKGGARTAVRQFFGEYLNLAALDVLVKDTERFPAATPTLFTAMRGEAERLVEDLVFDRGGTWLDLLDNRDTFVNDELAALYGLPPPDPGEVDNGGFGPVSWPGNENRAGILGSGAFLAVNGRITRTSPTLRGVFIQRRFFCFELPPPPPDVDGELPDQPANPKTMRELLEGHRTKTCAACHDLVDPMGLSMEHFDGIGQWRDDDNGNTLDVSGELGDVTWEGLAGLNEMLQNDPAVADCMARQVYRYATGHHESEPQDKIVDKLVADLAAVDYNMLEFLVTVVTSEGFRFMGAPGEEE